MHYYKNHRREPLAKKHHWNYEDTVLVLDLYHKTLVKPQKWSPGVISCAGLIATAGEPSLTNSVLYRLRLFAALDPKPRVFTFSALPGASKLDKEVWDKFYHDREGLTAEAEQIKTARSKQSNLIKQQKL